MILFLPDTIERNGDTLTLEYHIYVIEEENENSPRVGLEPG